MGVIGGLLILCGVAFVAGVILLILTRHELRTEREELGKVKPTRYYRPSPVYIFPWPFPYRRELVPVPQRSWKWQLGFGLTLYSLLTAEVIGLIKFFGYLSRNY